MRWFLVPLLVVGLTLVGCAKEAEAKGSKDPCKGLFAAILNECSPHTIDTDTQIDDKHYGDPKLGVMLDAPSLVLLPWDWSLGAEGGKDLYLTNTSEGWFAYIKLTWSGTLLNLRDK